ncbi:hypothetical protein GYH30_052943 [Glycine max]|nr:hypothetical protein GYH30_052943 [Glycine max]
MPQPNSATSCHHLWKPNMGEHMSLCSSQSMATSRKVVAVLADAPKEPVVYVPQVVAENDVDILI